jgi:hypothetical protein
MSAKDIKKIILTANVLFRQVKDNARSESIPVKSFLIYPLKRFYSHIQQFEVIFVIPGRSYLWIINNFISLAPGKGGKI